jgi:hypothetical protein
MVLAGPFGNVQLLCLSVWGYGGGYEGCFLMGQCPNPKYISLENKIQSSLRGTQTSQTSVSSSNPESIAEPTAIDVAELKHKWGTCLTGFNVSLRHNSQFYSQQTWLMCFIQKRQMCYKIKSTVLRGVAPCSLLKFTDVSAKLNASILRAYE